MGKESKIKTFKLSQKNAKGLNKIMKNGTVIVAFFMPPKRCSHCDALKPTWNQLMKKYKNISTKTPTALVTSVMGSEGLMDTSDTEVDGFPTIRVFRSGKKYEDYDKERSMDALSNFIDNKFGIMMSGGGRKYRKKLRTYRRKRRKKRRTRKKKRKLFFGLF
jgi:thiol-disulfide isomerase/thioredoxin